MHWKTAGLIGLCGVIAAGAASFADCAAPTPASSSASGDRTTPRVYQAILENPFVAGPKQLRDDVRYIRLVDPADECRDVNDRPDDIHQLCDDPGSVLDCTVPPEDYDQDQRWQCPDYLEFDL